MNQSFELAMQSFAPPLPLAIGLSGGADSTALLLASVRRWPGQVHAIHVHHGLQPAANGFEEHCIKLCTQLQVQLHVRRLDARHAPGESPEDAARRARYKAFDEVLCDLLASGVQSMALAQHADDQVETIVLALSRGAGVAGLAGMPAHWRRTGITWHRPLLAVSAHDVRAWLDLQEQPWVEDPTNGDERFTRNRIRAKLLPVLNQIFPAFRQTFARSASHAAQADELLEEIAVQDLEDVGVPPQIHTLKVLSRARQANVLRFWLRTMHMTTPTAAQLNELLHQIHACTTRGHNIRIKVGHGFVMRSGTGLDWYNP